MKMPMKMTVSDSPNRNYLCTRLATKEGTAFSTYSRRQPLASEPNVWLHCPGHAEL
jgi:hypothetical protein